MQGGGREEWSDGSGDDRDREEGDKDKKSEGHESPKDIEEEVTEEIEWPCSECGSNVSEDGLECIGCKMWCHADCSEVIYPKEYKVKQFKCPKCKEKRVSKSSKTKDGAIVKRRTWQTTQN